MKKFLAALALVTLAHSAAYAAGWKVIVNTANPTDSLTKKELASVFMKKTAKWDNGTPVVPVDQNEKSPVRADFTTDVHGKSVSAVKSYWQQQIFSGRDVPPVEKASEAQVIAFVKANAGAVAYVSDAADVSGTKTITVR